jgi:RNA polymerase sigma factor (sigma-70 family)
VGSLSNYADLQLVELVSKDDKSAFTELYRRYWSRLFTVAANKLDKDLSSAEELVQDIFLDLWRRRRDLQIKTSVAAYLAVALKYKVIDARIRRHRHQAYQAAATAKISIIDNSTEQQLCFNELKKRLESLIRDLPERSQLIYMEKESGCSHKEIADRLSISKKTVEAHLRKIAEVIRSKIRYILLRIAQTVC